MLQVAINNASDYEQPTIPDIDGCDVRSAGAPSQSSQVTIINGRRSEKRSVTMQYLITPRRSGTFEIPSFTVNVGGVEKRTRPMKFVATKSETGDLLFVEIEGEQDKVFVGQPLDLKLKLWIKPYADRSREIRLSEGNMWQMISEQTAWGSFADRLQQMAENNQRPVGREVLRDDGNGNQRAYYLYEIDATVYPKRPGSIDADDVQIVVDYPTQLGKARDPFGNFFGDRDPFGGRSPFGGRAGSMLSQMMDDDFFESPFRNRLSVSDSRPIAADATVDATQVIDVPLAGRPADYRGAVGKYQIVTQAEPLHVSAGDPITLQIGVVGTGPMELVQAPPLSELESLTTDFKVEDASLAGFVQDETKVFPTTIRPRREGITQIPAIPFSFFDPETESFQTVMSNPISITVDKAESLSLDAIVGNARQKPGADQADASAVIAPNFTNNNSADILNSQRPSTASNAWLAFVIVPPLVWLCTLIAFGRHQLGRRLANMTGYFQSARRRCTAAIKRARSAEQLNQALVGFIARTCRQPASSPTNAVGTLRVAGLYSVAERVEAFLRRNHRSTG